ncbi:Uncharacterized protein Rs2_01783 [Raphanus sativus]|nr:Uncharacterized protein Rs2_01783 [Raphanus sativus]
MANSTVFFSDLKFGKCSTEGDYLFLCLNGVEEDDVQCKPLFRILRNGTDLVLFHDNKLNGKFSDSVLEKYGPMRETSYFSTEIMGTFGYAALDYVATDFKKALDWQTIFGKETQLRHRFQSEDANI